MSKSCSRLMEIASYLREAKTEHAGYGNRDNSDRRIFGSRLARSTENTTLDSYSCSYSSNHRDLSASDIVSMPNGSGFDDSSY